MFAVLYELGLLVCIGFVVWFMNIGFCLLILMQGSFCSMNSSWLFCGRFMCCVFWWKFSASVCLCFSGVFAAVSVCSFVYG